MTSMMQAMSFKIRLPLATIFLLLQVFLIAGISLPTVGRKRHTFTTERHLDSTGIESSSINRLLRRFTDDSYMPSLFVDEEEELDRYAACLAATEGLRRILNADLTTERDLRHTSPKALADVEKQVRTNYFKKSSKVLRSFGMSVGQFNRLGRRISEDPELKKKVGTT